MVTVRQSRVVLSGAFVLLLLVSSGCQSTANFQPTCPAVPAPGEGLTRHDFRFGTSSIVEALRGRVSGLVVRTVQGRPFLQVRGSSSFYDVEPLVVVDGTRMAWRGARGLEALNVQDIASIEVLKGAADLAMYGADGGAGVIVVRTRRSGCAP
ncbi:MAG TPA: TonB-dependent receptor plug domain-containing protein [Rhodothermales bacterium]|nr:TonB-dependent receptor plug domain-containing protein [Rhodothermales bacterium]